MRIREEMKGMGKGLTLVEILLVVGILAMMVGVMTGSLNPLALINRGKDARRKKDITRIKVAMEGYWADKGCFPTGSLLTDLNSVANCGSRVVFDPWLDNWPCDPNGESYYVFTEEIGCPSWFKVIVDLENRSDRDIPEWWYENDPDSYFIGDGSLSNTDANFGVSSTNVLWYERIIDPTCFGFGRCHYRVLPELGEGSPCQSIAPEGADCAGSSNCYLNGSCFDECKVTCCNYGEPC